MQDSFTLNFKVITAFFRILLLGYTIFYTQDGMDAEYLGAGYTKL